MSLHDEIHDRIVTHLRNLMETFTNYLETAPNANWIRNPFIADLQSMEDDDELKEQIDLKGKTLLKKN